MMKDASRNMYIEMVPGAEGVELKNEAPEKKPLRGLSFIDILSKPFDDRIYELSATNYDRDQIIKKGLMDLVSCSVGSNDIADEKHFLCISHRFDSKADFSAVYDFMLNIERIPSAYALPESY